MLEVGEVVGNLAVGKGEESTQHPLHLLYSPAIDVEEVRQFLKSSSGGRHMSEGV